MTPVRSAACLNRSLPPPAGWPRPACASSRTASSAPATSVAMCAHAWSQLGGENASPISANDVTARCRTSACWVLTRMRRSRIKDSNAALTRSAASGASAPARYLRTASSAPRCRGTAVPGTVTCPGTSASVLIGELSSSSLPQARVSRATLAGSRLTNKCLPHRVQVPDRVRDVECADGRRDRGRIRWGHERCHRVDVLLGAGRVPVPA
jgi:hypothetical protein